MSSKCVGFVMNACESLEGYQRLIRRHCEKYSAQSADGDDQSPKEFPSREELGLLLLKSKEHYKHHIVLTAVDMLIDMAMAQHALSSQQLVDAHLRDSSFAEILMINDQSQRILQSCEILLESVNNLDLDRVWEKNMLLSGDELKKVFLNIPPGTITVHVMTKA